MVTLGVSTVQVQTQNLIITPELRQSIEILQLSSLDLLKYLEEKALENPAIEIDEDVPYPTFAKTGGSGPKDANNNWIESVSRKRETLESCLLEQLMYLSIDSQTRKIAEYLIGNINPCGYLDISTDDIAVALNTTKNAVEEALALIQSFEPAGVGARNLKECLLLQLRRLKGKIHPLAAPIIESHLGDVADGKIKQVAKALGVPPREVQNAMEEIRLLLHPKPGVAYEMDDSLFIVPDLYVRKVGEQYKLYLNNALFPKVSVHQAYIQTIEDSATIDPAFVRYLQEHVQSAMWIKRSLDKRKKTIIRVSEALMRHQVAFLEQGVEFLKPLNLKDIASELDLHESTVSRTIQGKYIQTPHGVFELKYFFSAGLSQGGGNVISSHSVKMRIAYEIDRENPYRPISDAQICALLNKEKIAISRRTVAKYREELRIPASSKRKRYD
jgi:RNA polymerase sigma-54 factor